MKTRTQIILFLIIILVGSVSVFYATKVVHYTLEIQGMKEEYFVGEEYSFYYTLVGYGNTCHSWTVFYPDQNGEIKKAGEAVDCTRHTNKELDYDSRNESRMFSSKVPQIEGKYNVTVSLENIKPVTFEFVVKTNPSNYDGIYESENLLCIGGRGMIVNEDCEIIGRYDVSTGLPIVENKEQCDLLNGTWDEQQNICDSKYGTGLNEN